MKPSDIFKLTMMLFCTAGCAAKSDTASSPASKPSKAETSPASEIKADIPSPIPANEPVPTPIVDVSLDSPKDVIRKYTEELRKIADPSQRRQKGLRDVSQEQKLAQKVREFFDFPALARLSLGRHWYRLTPAQQQEFSKLFIDLVEESYLRRSRDIVGNYNLRFGEEAVNDNQAKVTVSVARADADVDIVYELHRKNKNWMIFNIVLDDVDLIRNYQTQFNQIISKSSFDSLLSKMKKKLEEVEKEVTL